MNPSVSSVVKEVLIETTENTEEHHREGFIFVECHYPNKYVQPGLSVLSRAF